MDKVRDFLARHSWAAGLVKSHRHLTVRVSPLPPYPHFAYVLSKDGRQVRIVFSRNELYFARDPARHAAVRIRSAYRQLKRKVQEAACVTSS